MEALNLSFGFIGVLILMMVVFLLATSSLLAGLVFTLEALEKGHSLKILAIFWLLILPPTLLFLCCDFFETLWFYTITLPFSITALFRHKKKIKPNSQNHSHSSISSVTAQKNIK
jgi:hypothetical protein